MVGAASLVVQPSLVGQTTLVVRRLSFIVALALVAGCMGGSNGASSGSDSSSNTSGAVLATGPLRLEELATGLDSPLYALVVPDGTGRTAVLEQGGTVRLWKDGALASTPFLDITDRTDNNGEQGLLGLAFHPDYATNKVAIVSYTNTAGDSVVSRMKLKADGSALDAAGEDVLLQVDQPFSNHNGGHLLFSPADGMLYFGLGDGGSANDPAGHGQNKGTLLGSMLRIQVGATGAYTVPPDNPFVGEQGTPPETWSYGWRNPWRFHFDDNGDMWVGDVGQNAYEEMDFEPAGQGGRNYGWNVYEGNHSHPASLLQPPALTRPPGYTFPVAEYGHEQSRCSVTGGPVYRGERLPDLIGHVLYGDYCSGTIWAMNGPQGTPRVLLESGVWISSFGVDADGEALVLDHLDGKLLRLTR